MISPRVPIQAIIVVSTPPVIGRHRIYATTDWGIDIGRSGVPVFARVHAQVNNNKHYSNYNDIDKIHYNSPIYFFKKYCRKVMTEHTNTYTTMMPCTLVGNAGPLCPAGWESVGYTKPGSCVIGAVPGDGHLDVWQKYGYQRVCKRKVPSSNDLAVDCCSNLFGISSSLECKARGFKPYSWTCNNIMMEKCNTNVQQNKYGPEWDGIPGGQTPTVYDGCSGKVRSAAPPKKPGCVDPYCVNYLRNAPPNNFLHDHDYTDYPHHFPRHSYTTPAFSGSWGYQPMRTPYRPYNDWKNKQANNYCRQFPQECWNTTINNFHF